nr:sensor histidine kinase KdpD [Maliibacterium massiliense]
MCGDGRPDPDKLLEQLEADVPAQPNGTRYGRLKIFFGYAAGVGKTYAMLRAAHDAKAAGADVVVGYVEPHARPETLALLDGLEQLPHLVLRHKNITLREFDLDAALARHPQIMLVDELAHTNAEGCRHTKRYKDIEELRRAGIDVYTTVNVQHIESLNDIIASITGVAVRERIPDEVFDSAEQVELVDIEPEELIARFNQGKVYRAHQAKHALHHFFSMENLVALREIALRRTADRVNRIFERKKQLSARADYFTEEHILICLSPAPSSAKVIRTAARMAGAFHGQFTALFVETPQFAQLCAKDRARLQENIQLAKQLGARVVTVFGDDVALQIAEYARAAGVSKVVLGRSNTKRRLFLAKATFSERLSELAPNLDIYIIPDKMGPAYRRARRSMRLEVQKYFSLGSIFNTLLVLVGSTLLGLWFQHLGFSEANIIMVYILGVVISALVTTGRVYCVAASLLSVLTFNYLFTEPRFTLAAYDKGYPVTFLIMFAVALVIGTLTTRIKEQARISARKAYRTEILLDTSQMLQRAETQQDIIDATAHQMRRLLDKTIVFYPAADGALAAPQVFPREDALQRIDGYIADDERAVAQWVFKNNKHAGATTSTLPGAKCLYLAVRGNAQVFAVVGVAMDDGAVGTYETNLLIAMLGECALALEKVQLNQTKNEIALKAQKEQLRANLLRAISHDLRTPLTSISGNAGVLIGNADTMDAAKKQQLYTDIYDDAMWLINLVENLLSVTRIEDGTMQIHMEGELIAEVVAEALRHVDRKASEHHIAVDIPDDLLLARMDARLIMQVIINIVDNAIKYTPAGSHITVSARRADAFVAVEIADDGDGIPDDAKEKVFDMFYTASNGRGDSRRGLGLGLALCRSIILAHGGQMYVRDNAPHGAVFHFTLQAEEVTIHE